MSQRLSPTSVVDRVRQAAAEVAPGLVGEGAGARMALALAGFVPVTLIAVSTFDIFGLRDLATHVLVPVVLAIVVLVNRQRGLAPMIVRALGAALVATALYDLVRFGFLWTGLMDRDPIPHIGTALGLRPAWVFGYLWRYLGNGGGLAIAFWALGIRGVRNGILYGLFVCGGLLTTLVVSPHAQEILFPLTPITVVMATIGHMIYGAVLGAIAVRERRPVELASVSVLRSRPQVPALAAA